MHPAIAQQQQQTYESLHDEYHQRAHGRDRMKEAREMPETIVLDHKPYIPLVVVIKPEYDPDNNEWFLACKIGTFYGKSKDEVTAKYSCAVRLYNTNCPTCGHHTSQRVCPECGQDREWYASEAGGMWGEHIQHGQA